MCNLTRQEKAERFVGIIMEQGVIDELKALLDIDENGNLRTEYEVQEALEKILSNKTPKEALTHLINKMSAKEFKNYEVMFEI